MTKFIDQTEDAIADLRDRTASTLAANDPTEYTSALTQRALDRLTDKVEDLRDSISDDLSATADRMQDGIDALRGDLTPDSSTSWWSRMAWLAVGAGLGTAAAKMMSDGTMSDGKGAERLESLKVRAQELKDDAKHQLEVQKGKAQGAANRMTGETDRDDPKLLRQKIRSEVIGRVEGADDVVVIVHDEGEVELKGLVETRETADELLAGIEQVPGVRQVTESLQVNAASS